MNTLSETEINIYIPSAEGVDWIWSREDLCRQYTRFWVVTIPERVVAAGDDPTTVKDEAAKILGIKPADGKMLIVTGIAHPDSWKLSQIHSGLEENA